MHAVDTHFRISADCSRSGKCSAVVIWKVWQCSDSADGTNANRSCGNLRSMQSKLLWWSDWPSSSPQLACFHPNNCFEILPLHHVPHHDCHYHITYWSSATDCSPWVNAQTLTQAQSRASQDWEAKLSFQKQLLIFWSRSGLGGLLCEGEGKNLKGDFGLKRFNFPLSASGHCRNNCKIIGTVTCR